MEYKGEPKIHTVVLHNTAVSRATQPEQLAVVERYHKDKWGMKSELGWHVGYNFFCEPDGTRTQTRKVGEETIAQIGNNCDVPERCGMISYCMAGYFKVEKPTIAQVADFVEFFRDVQKRYPKVKLKQHKDVYPGRTCAELDDEDIQTWIRNPVDSNVYELREQVEILTKQNLQLIELVRTLLRLVNK